ncbi:uncharacterized protein LOC18441582 isoform X1 [Amborella trichopoda]|uniref:uncharacterized protein LOC18441582 isoform X1 n=1 Tax=Amborella trichopoda TaxID=13333 RepID=UPI0009BF810F|nr:uncharacterized protein LOC18441582 isoform X1 [Amborella trichopoda]|eukprot:XP_020527541.1 uncharacterized protein LOC18441582 isoform X1 [Amborella trichopoda]
MVLSTFNQSSLHRTFSDHRELLFPFLYPYDPFSQVFFVDSFALTIGVTPLQIVNLKLNPELRKQPPIIRVLAIRGLCKGPQWVFSPRKGRFCEKQDSPCLLRFLCVVWSSFDGRISWASNIQLL